MPGWGGGRCHQVDGWQRHRETGTQAGLEGQSGQGPEESQHPSAAHAEG